MFDVSPQKRLTKTWEIDMPVEEEDWEIGIIVGPSGAGKTTIAKKIFGEENYFAGVNGFDWSHQKAFISEYPEKITNKELTKTLTMVGFSSPPSWLLPFDKLSNGQKFRAEMARIILETDEIAIVDEFTSVVDRNVAKVCSFAVQKLVRERKKKLVAVSCHYDIIDWLEPDWVYYVDSNEFKRGRLRRPEIQLEICRVDKAAWRIFKGHHYLNTDAHNAAHYFVAMWENNPVALVAALAFPHKYVKNIWKSHRTVVLPDYQGVGIGGIMTDTIAQYYLDLGKRFTGVASHPAMIAHRNNSPKWKLTRKPGRTAGQGKGGKVTSTASNRLTASHEYIGDGSVKTAEIVSEPRKEDQ
jgi:ABC-type ATPase involved in cell division/GNAT superfamily N-acetyltransferase